MIERRDFSGCMKGKNLRYLEEVRIEPMPHARVGFLLLEHFSLPAFTQVLDTIVTANLLTRACSRHERLGCRMAK